MLLNYKAAYSFNNTAFDFFVVCRQSFYNETGKVFIMYGE